MSADHSATKGPTDEHDPEEPTTPHSPPLLRLAQLPTALTHLLAGADEPPPAVEAPSEPAADATGGRAAP
jgi:hypothetical protein